MVFSLFEVHLQCDELARHAQGKNDHWSHFLFGRRKALSRNGFRNL